MDNDQNEIDLNIKRSLNISNSILERKIWRKITFRQIILLICGVFITLIGTVLLFVYISSIVGFIFLISSTTIVVIFLIRNCLLFKIFKLFFKYLFSAKSKNIKNVDAKNGTIFSSNSKFVFFEINCEPVIGTEQMINRKINDIISQFSIFTNFSIINSHIPFGNLNNINLKIEELINDYKNYDLNDPVFLNLIANKYLINKYSSGQFTKNTFLVCFEVDKNFNLKILFDNIKNLNKNLNYLNFKLLPISDLVFDWIKSEYFLFDKQIKNKIDFIQTEKKYYHFIKINGLPSFLEIGYLDFLNDLSDSLCKLSFSINTYNLKSFKKEEKFWENAIKIAEKELENSCKRNDEIIAMNNYEAIQELTAQLVESKGISQKYEIIIRLECDTKKDILNYKRRIRSILKKQYKFELDFDKFNQLDLFKRFCKNLIQNPKITKKQKLNVLPNNLILWSFPFMSGNVYFKKGLFLGELFNSNPLFFSLNQGKKENNSAIIVGKTGCGKTTFINFLLKNNLSEKNIFTILLDPKGEYCFNQQVLKMNPKIISIDDNSSDELKLNPFLLCENDEKSEKIDFMLNFFQIWFENSWNLNIKNKITNILELASVSNNWNIDSFYDLLQKYLNIDELEDKLILTTIKNLTSKGIYKYFSKSNDKNQFDIFKNRLVIFNLSSILLNYSNLNKIKLLLIFKYLKNFIYKQENLFQENKNKIQIIVDEFPAIANPTAPFIVTEFVSMIRLVRSYDTSLILAMQDMVRFESADVESNESLKSIANNVKHKFIMQMNQQQLDIMKKIWGDSVELSNDEEEMITMKFNHGDILYLNENSRFYFNSTDPISNYSSFDIEEIKAFAQKFIQNKINDPEQETKITKEQEGN